jgi:hypothetical protein
MLARLLLALLLVAFALPALANGPCHDAPMPAMAHMLPGDSHDMPRHGDTIATPHVCIGCIPPASLAVTGTAPPLRATALPRRIVAAAFDPASGTPPALPPPRSNA